MRIGITDSGVGGLSVCAELEVALRQAGIADDIELLYLNAALEDDYAYNSMPNRQIKLTTFDCFLDHVTTRYQLDYLFIACNSLSVLYGDTRFARDARVTVQGIVETGQQQILGALKESPASAVMVFATPTTIEEGVYGRLLRGAGLPQERLVEQACPGLADAISNDHSGGQARALLDRFIPRAFERLGVIPQDVLAFLGCTHYGYQADLFRSCLLQHVPAVRVLNPNPGAAAAILEHIRSPAGHGAVNIRVISRYSIPERPMASLCHYLGDISPATLDALRHFETVPDLYGPLELKDVETA